MGCEMRNETEFIFDEVLQEGFTIVPNSIFNSGISYKAIGLYTSILRVKNIPNWKIYQSNLITEKDKKSSVASAMKELIEAKFIEKITLRDDKGRIKGIAYKVYCSPKPDFPISDKQKSENQPLKNKDNKNKDNIYSCVINYLNNKIGSKYRSNTSATKSLINARLKDGFTLDEFYKVIDIKADEWLNSEMSKYLRPQTLFGTKFESYLNQLPKQQPNIDNDGIREF